MIIKWVAVRRFFYVLAVTFLFFVSIFAKKSFGEVFLTQKQAIKFIFPEVKEVKEEKHTVVPEKWKKFAKKIKKAYRVKLHKEYDKEFNFLIGISTDGTISHYAYIDVVHGKWGPITYIVAITPEGEVKNLAVISYTERRGKPIRERKFLGQFIGKFLSDHIKLKKDIDAITGATISSRGITNGIRKVLALFEEFYRKEEVVSPNRVMPKSTTKTLPQSID